MKSMQFMKSFALAFACLAAGCGEPGGSGDDQELITTIVLTFMTSNGDTVIATYDDPDGDGGDAPSIEAIHLAPSTSYMLTVTFENRLESPPEIISDEVRDEGTDHQLFFTGDAVNGPAANNPSAPVTHAYADTDSAGLPIGLENMMATAPGGAGALTVTLRHMPPVNNVAVKTSTTASDVATGGISAIGGETDATATFGLSVF